MSFISPSSSFHFLKFKKILEVPGERGPFCFNHSCSMQHITNVQLIFTEQMDTSILMFGEGTIAPLCHSSPASTQRQLEDLQGDLKRMPGTFLHQKLGDRRRAAAPLCQVHELFAFISVLLPQFTGLRSLHYPDCNGKIKFTLPEAKTCDILQLNLMHRHQTETR